MQLFAEYFGFVGHFQNSIFFFPLPHSSPCRVEHYTNATSITILLGWDCRWDGNSDACIKCFLMNKIIIFTTKILPFHPVTDSKYFGPTTLLTPDWTLTVEHCCAALRRRDCTSARYFLTGAQLCSVGQFCPSPKGFQLWGAAHLITCGRDEDLLYPKCKVENGYVRQRWLCACLC